MLANVVLLVLAGASDGLHFVGESRCPAPEAVEAQLRRIAPRVLESQVQLVAQIDSVENGLRVRLFDSGGRLLEERTMTGPKSCAQWAQVSAALLATWNTAPVAPDPPLSNLPKSAPAVPSPPPAEVAPPPAASEEPSGRWKGEFGLGVMSALANDGASALGLELLAGLEPAGRPFGFQLTLNGTTARSFPLANGEGIAHWQRFALGLGGYGLLGSRELKLEIGAAFLAGLITSYGTQILGSPNNAAAFDPGIGTSVRGCWGFARSWLAWLQIGASFWLKSEVQVLSGMTQVSKAPVPPIDASVTVGLSVKVDI